MEDRISEGGAFAIPVGAVRVEDASADTAEGTYRVVRGVLVAGESIPATGQERPGAVLIDGRKRVAQAGPFVERQRAPRVLKDVGDDF